jgi:hypothetical protein
VAVVDEAVHGEDSTGEANEEEGTKVLGDKG